jgi:hypothetical protein
MPFNGALDDRQPQAESGLLGAGVVQLHERLERPVTILLGDSRAVVVDQQLVYAIVHVERDANVLLGISNGVVE